MAFFRRMRLRVRRVFYKGERTAYSAAHPTTHTTATTTGVRRTHAPGHWGRKFRRAMFWRRRPRATVTI